MNWRIGCITLAILGLAACKGEPSGAGGTSSASAAPQPTLPKLTDKMPSSISASRPEAKTGDEPKADFKNFDQVYKEQKEAIGKTVLFQGYGTPLKPDLSHLSECKPSTKRTNILATTFKAEQRDLMRAMPSNQFVQGGQCPRIVVKITGFHAERRYPEGELVDVYGLQPDPPPAKLPAGVDFISMDDVFLAGPAAVGKVADFGVYIGTRDVDWILVATGCTPHGGWNAQLQVAETDANRSFFENLKKEGSSMCVRVRAKITKAPKDTLVPRWGAELTGVGDQYPKPHPAPNP